MEPSHFSKLLTILEELDSSKDKKIFLQTAISGNTFTCEQVAQILEKITFSREQLQILKIIRSHLSDLENTFQIVEKFTSTKDQKKASALLGQPEDVEAIPRYIPVKPLLQSAENKSPIMESSAFTELLEILDHQKFPKEQLYFVELAAFRNTFTSIQVVQLLEKFQFIRYKLKALKILRYRITDPENYFLLLSVFSHTSYKKKVSALLMS